MLVTPPASPHTSHVLNCLAAPESDFLRPPLEGGGPLDDGLTFIGTPFEGNEEVLDTGHTEFTS